MLSGSKFGNGLINKKYLQSSEDGLDQHQLVFLFQNMDQHVDDMFFCGIEPGFRSDCLS